MKTQSLFSKIALFAGALVLFSTCKTGDGGGVEKCVEPPLIMSLEQDKQLGAQVDAQLKASPAEFPILDSATNVAAYKYLYDMRDRILNATKSGQPIVKTKDDFAWKLRIIKDDNTLNAFCTPGGYIYVYTGIIKFLDSADDLAGVMGHEIAHADLRHSARQMQNAYGIAIISQVILGENPGILVEMANKLRELKNSRCHESQADEASVNYLGGTNGYYKCNGAATFFQKIEALGGSRVPQILSTHPNPGNRVENINNKAAEVGCNTTTSQESPATYAQFKALL